MGSSYGLYARSSQPSLVRCGLLTTFHFIPLASLVPFSHRSSIIRTIDLPTPLAISICSPRCTEYSQTKSPAGRPLSPIQSSRSSASDKPSRLVVALRGSEYYQLCAISVYGRASKAVHRTHIYDLYGRLYMCLATVLNKVLGYSYSGLHTGKFKAHYTFSVSVSRISNQKTQWTDQTACITRNPPEMYISCTIDTRNLYSAQIVTLNIRGSAVLFLQVP